MKPVRHPDVAGTVGVKYHLTPRVRCLYHKDSPQHPFAPVPLL